MGTEYSTEALTATKLKMEAFLGDAQRAAETAEWIKKAVGTEKQNKVLNIFDRTFKCFNAYRRSLYIDISRFNSF